MHPDQAEADLISSIDHSIEAKLQNLANSENISSNTTSNTKQIIHSMTRSISSSNGETIEGDIQVSLSPGEREKCIHIPFVPPLDHKPELSIETNNAQGARVTSTALYNYGMRLAIRLSEPAVDTKSVHIYYQANVPPST